MPINGFNIEIDGSDLSLAKLIADDPCTLGNGNDDVVEDDVTMVDDDDCCCC